MDGTYPFSAIVGQEEMKQALLVAAVEPTIGGVLIFGDRGTGKSTAVRALATLLPQIEVIANCSYNCAPDTPQGLCQVCTGTGSRKSQKRRVPVVDMPLGVTEDRVIGALNLERALSHGEKSFEPGLLANANRGFLYIDEVNLLEDHLVDLLLDVAATGENVVEREGLSVRHPARFVLVGSGNPEEGDLRPQLLDRFGLSVDVKTPDDLETRIEVVKRRDAYERDPKEFLKKWKRRDQKIRRQIVDASSKLEEVEVPDQVLRLVAQLCVSLGTDGLRGELTVIRAARAVAALEGHSEVEIDHVRQIALPALRHRLRRDPLDEAGSSVRVERAVDELLAP